MAGTDERTLRAAPQASSWMAPLAILPKRTSDHAGGPTCPVGPFRVVALPWCFWRSGTHVLIHYNSTPWDTSSWWHPRSLFH
jgi:hypothetical protein